MLERTPEALPEYTVCLLRGGGACAGPWNAGAHGCPTAVHVGVCGRCCHAAAADAAAEHATGNGIGISMETLPEGEAVTEATARTAKGLIDDEKGCGSACTSGTRRAGDTRAHDNGPAHPRMAPCIAADSAIPF